MGISCFYHDSAVTLIKDEKIIFAAQEERFSRIKHDSSFPKKSIQYLLKITLVLLLQGLNDLVGILVFITNYKEMDVVNLKPTRSFRPCRNINFSNNKS